MLRTWPTPLAEGISTERNLPRHMSPGRVNRGFLTDREASDQGFRRAVTKRGGSFYECSNAWNGWLSSAAARREAETSSGTPK